MGIANSRIEESEILEKLVPKTFRNCVYDLTTEQLTEKKKKKIERYVFTYVETYLRTKERTAEQFLLSDYSDYLY